MKPKNPIDDYFKEKLEGHKIKPSGEVWEKINAELHSEKEQRNGGWYVMRAAVILVLVGISSLFYFQNNEASLMKVEENISAGEPVENADTEKPRVQSTESQGKKTEQQKPAGKKDPGKEETKKPGRKAIPLVHPNTGSQQIIVEHDAEMELGDESLLVDEEEMMLTAELQPRAKSAAPQPGVKIKMTLSPATAKAFYADAEEKPAGEKEDNRDLKERMFAYATDQIDNIRTGKKLELPKPNRKPQLEINLDRIF